MLLPLLLACTAPSGDTGADDTAVPIDPVSFLVNAGPHHVGYRQRDVTYADATTGTDRTLRVAAWYPTEESTGGDASYLDGAIDAPGVLDDPTPRSGTLPLVVFSHGHQGFAENSSFLAEHLASHGFVVLAPDHTGNTTFDSADRTTEIYAQRPLDLSAVIDQVDTLVPAATTDVVVIGHSFGGYTAFALAGAAYDPAAIEACTPEASSFCSTMTPALDTQFRAGFADPRIVGAVAMAPGDYDLFGPANLGNLSGPALLMTGEMDPGDGDPYWAALQGGANRRLHVLGAGHQAFTDFSGALPDGGTIDPEVGFSIIRAYALALVATARGDGASFQEVLDGTLPIDEAAVISR